MIRKAIGYTKVSFERIYEWQLLAQGGPSLQAIKSASSIVGHYQLGRY